MCPLLSRSIYNAAVWFYHHCQDRMPVVMVTEDEEAVQQYGSETEGVFVISFKVLPAIVCVCVCVSEGILINISDDLGKCVP